MNFLTQFRLSNSKKKEIFGLKNLLKWKMRKEFLLKQYEKIKLHYQIFDESIISEILREKQKEYIYPTLKTYLLEKSDDILAKSKTISINDTKIKLYLSK